MCVYAGGHAAVKVSMVLGHGRVGGGREGCMICITWYDRYNLIVLRFRAQKIWWERV